MSEKEKSEVTSKQSESLTGSGSGLTKDQANLLIQTGIIPKNTPVGQIKLFAKVCEERGLSPFSGQIHLIHRNTKEGGRYTMQTSIDGLRSIAERTGQLAGIDDYEFTEPNTSNPKHPVSAKATVRKLLPTGDIGLFSYTARWSEFAPTGGQAFMWRKMPYHMLGKVAEAQCLRKAFPECQKVYIEEEQFHSEPKRLSEQHMNRIFNAIENGNIDDVKDFLDRVDIIEEQRKEIYDKMDYDEFI